VIGIGWRACPPILAINQASAAKNSLQSSHHNSALELRSSGDARNRLPAILTSAPNLLPPFGTPFAAGWASSTTPQLPTTTPNQTAGSGVYIAASRDALRAAWLDQNGRHTCMPWVLLHLCATARDADRQLLSRRTRFRCAVGPPLNRTFSLNRT
jgi:hypothetical protein